jgi:hypothetical protein
MATSTLANFKNPIVAANTLGTTYTYVVLKNGKIYRHAISGNALTLLGRVRGDVKCVVADGTTATYLYLGMADGRLIKFTVANGVNSILARADSAIVAIALASTAIWLGCEDGHFMLTTTTG